MIRTNLIRLIISTLFWSPRIHGFQEEYILNLENDEAENGSDEPTVQLTIFVRNKALYLPYFFGLIDEIDYPKRRISLYVRGDHCADDSLDITKDWVENVRPLYARLDVVLDGTTSGFPTESSPFEWHERRYQQMVELKEEAFDAAKESRRDFIFFVDADNLLVNKNVLRDLIDAEKTIVAPMLDSPTAYSNFWGDVTEHFFYKRSDNYFDIRNRDDIGIFPVPMVHSTMLIDLRKRESALLTFKPNPGYKEEYDDIIIFAFNAKWHKIQMWILNLEDYGKLPTPLEADGNFDDEFDSFHELMRETSKEAGIDDAPILVSQFLTPKFPKDKMGFDQIYVINLKRRENRRLRMEFYLDNLGKKINVSKSTEV
jgi:collagen beta-1,O-galactosyltransferase